MMTLLLANGGILPLVFARGLAHGWSQLFALIVVLIN
jgi:hypothetical protein